MLNSRHVPDENGTTWLLHRPGADLAVDRLVHHVAERSPGIWVVGHHVGATSPPIEACRQVVAVIGPGFEDGLNRWSDSVRVVLDLVEAKRLTYRPVLVGRQHAPPAATWPPTIPRLRDVHAPRLAVDDLARLVEHIQGSCPPPTELLRLRRLAFISYRRSDTALEAMELARALRAQMSGWTVFLDVTDMPGGVRFQDHLRATVRDATVVLAVIGPRWFVARTRVDPPRIAGKTDPVRLELKDAYRFGKHVIPVLVGGARMPTLDQLPRGTRWLATERPVNATSSADETVATLRARLHWLRLWRWSRHPAVPANPNYNTEPEESPLKGRGTAPGTALVRSIGHTYFVDICPYCGGSHTHNGAGPGDVVGSFVGTRASHCAIHGDYKLFVHQWPTEEGE